MTDMLQVLREFGFPIFVCVWFMWRLERRIEKLADDNARLLTTVTVIAKTLDVPEEG